MDKILYLVVEGFTESKFCEKNLKPYFERKGIKLNYLLIKTNQNLSNKAFRGGSISINKLIENLGLVQNPNFIVSTLIDYYGFENYDNLNIEELTNKISIEVKKQFKTYNNFIPYIQQYEIETLLYCSPEITSKYLSHNDNGMCYLKQDLKENNNEPEKINNGKNTAPSKRIEKAFNQYRKGNLDFTYIIDEIGIEKIKNKCPRFKEWLDKLEIAMKNFI